MVSRFTGWTNVGGGVDKGGHSGRGWPEQPGRGQGGRVGGERLWSCLNNRPRKPRQQPLKHLGGLTVKNSILEEKRRWIVGENVGEF